MTTQTVGYKAKAFEPRNLLIFVLINSVGPMVVFAPFILRILSWPAVVPPGLAIILVLLQFAPVITAFVMAGITEGKSGVRILWGCFWTRHVSIRWLLIALLVWPVVFLVIKLFASRLEGYPFYPIFSFLDYPWTTFPSAYLFGLVLSLREDFGWFGYLLPRLQARWNALASGVLVGVFWALMHLPNWFMPPGNPGRDDSFWAFALQIILASLLYTWLFNNARGRLLPVSLAHTMSNTVGALLAIPDSYLLYLNWALLLVVIPIVIFFGARNLVRQRPGEGTRREGVGAIPA